MAAPGCGSTAPRGSLLGGAGPGAVPVLCPGSGWPPSSVWLGGAGPLPGAAEDCSAGSPPRGGARWGPLRPPFWGGLGPGHGAGGGRPLSTVGGVSGRLDSLEPRVGSDKACVPDDEDGFTAVSRPVSVLRPSMVSKLSEDSGSRASEVSLDDILNCFSYLWGISSGNLI